MPSWCHCHPVVLDKWPLSDVVVVVVVVVVEYHCAY